MAKTVTDDNFKQEIVESKSDKPILVDFWAGWCPPCVAIAPHLDKFSEAHGDKINIAKLDVEANSAIPTQYQISALPSLLVFQGGEVKKIIRGFRSKTQLEMELADFIS